MSDNKILKSLLIIFFVEDGIGLITINFFDASHRFSLSLSVFKIPHAASKATGVRGVSWRRDETLDLLALWGEQNVQEALRSCHRNIDSFEMISKEMAKRGHNRTAVECRTKAKALRLEYKRVVTLNSQTGSNRATCPYFEELHRILRGDASVKPKRVPRSLNALRKPAEPEGPDPMVQEGSEQLLTHDLPTVKMENNMEDMHSSTPAPSG